MNFLIMLIVLCIIVISIITIICIIYIILIDMKTFLIVFAILGFILYKIVSGLKAFDKGYDEHRRRKLVDDNEFEGFEKLPK